MEHRPLHGRLPYPTARTVHPGESVEIVWLPLPRVQHTTGWGRLDDNHVHCRTVMCRYAANQTASLSASQAVVDVRHRLSLRQDGCFVLFVEAAVSLFALALHVSCRLSATVSAQHDTTACSLLGAGTVAH